MLYESFLGNLLDHIKNPKKKIGYIGKKLQELYDDPEFTIDERKKLFSVVIKINYLQYLEKVNLH